MRNLFELTRDQILRSVDEKFIHHQQHEAELKDKLDLSSAQTSDWFIYDAFGNSLIIKIRSSKGDRFYLNKLSFRKEFDKIQRRYLQMDKFDFTTDEGVENFVNELKKLMWDIVENGEINIYCSCDAFLYWGYSYISTKKRYNYPSQRENRPPDIRNPEQRNSICKHLSLTLKNMDNNRIHGFVAEVLTDLYIISRLNRNEDIINLTKERRKRWWIDYFAYFDGEL
jgi:hypothetical protein